jgi:phosphoglucomutase
VEIFKEVIRNKEKGIRKKPDCACYDDMGAKQEALSAYKKFATEVFSGGDEGLVRELKAAIAAKPLALAADFNGSARCSSIDRDFFAELGLRFYTLNDKAGEIAHRIVPEGESLEPLKAFLAQCVEKDPAVRLGYMCDCDGDRGNLVILRRNGPPRIVDAQEVFALAVLSGLCQLVYQGKPLDKATICVNDPTSLRIDEIAACFGAQVFRAEVGEANVVGLARKKHAEGWETPVYGEGSNGGNITWPQSVRDPLSTVLAAVKLLRLPGFYNIWRVRRGLSPLAADADITLEDIIDSFPRYATTGAYEDEALLHVQTTDHAALKKRYQEVFEEEWQAKQTEFRERYGITGWKAFRFNGLEEREAPDFADALRGGLKILFYGGSAGTGGVENAIASLWMRGSGTEPVFRFMADVTTGGGQGLPAELERELIAWQRDMVSRADKTRA